MNTRERIKEIADYLYRHAETLEFRGDDKTVSDIVEAADFLADLPAEKPPTLAEFRESGEEFIIKYHTHEALPNTVVVSYIDGKLWIGRGSFVPEWATVTHIARMPRFYPVEGGTAVEAKALPQPRDLLGLYSGLNIDSVPTTLADDLRELLGWAAASFPQGGEGVEYFTDNIKHILRKHGEAEG